MFTSRAPRLTLQPLDDFARLDVIFSPLANDPILLFKHSVTCGISVQAHEEIVTLLREDLPLSNAYLVSVQASRDLSNAIAARSRIRHASPQVMLVHGGEVRWHASHSCVTASHVRAALQQVIAAA